VSHLHLQVLSPTLIVTRIGLGLSHAPTMGEITSLKVAVSDLPQHLTLKIARDNATYTGDHELDDLESQSPRRVVANGTGSGSENQGDGVVSVASMLFFGLGSAISYIYARLCSTTRTTGSYSMLPGFLTRLLIVDMPKFLGGT
jgi:hypothetical protein